MAEKVPVALFVNGENRQVLVDPRQNLLQTLRADLGLTGAKCGCGHGVCGACTVLIDGEAVLACLALTVAQAGREIGTVEGLADDEASAALVQAFVDCGALQCGFCTPGMIVAARALLQRNPRPTVEEIRHGLGGNVCRCTGYVKIVDAVRTASGAVQP
ncbi:MAG: (2Fe-2S)-binding protein [Gammaproteobacteria bacterium]|nr:(2Fe-2S)-binding protein [Gammaproteobacteria bacterium]MDE0366444.1 (2Fe-2S)-binding protein [Gammaproteobacteria bacterium]